MSLVDDAAGQAQSTASSVDEVTTGLEGIGGTLDDFANQAQAIGAEDKAAQAAEVSSQLDSVKSQAAALKSSVEELGTAIRGLSG